MHALWLWCPLTVLPSTGTVPITRSPRAYPSPRSNKCPYRIFRADPPEIGQVGKTRHHTMNALCHATNMATQATTGYSESTVEQRDAALQEPKRSEPKPMMWHHSAGAMEPQEPATWAIYHACTFRWLHQQVPVMLQGPVAVHRVSRRLMCDLSPVAQIM